MTDRPSNRVSEPAAPSFTEAPGSRVAVRAGLLGSLGSARRFGSFASRVSDPTVVCVTPRLSLRPLRESDRAEFLRVFTLSRSHLARYCPLSTDEHDQQPADEVFDRQVLLAQRAVETGRAWRVCGFDDRGRLAGAFNVNDISRGLENVGELVSWIGVEHSGQGIATEGLLAVIQHAFADLPRGLGLHKLIALVAPENAPCARLVRRLGMRLLHQPPVGLKLAGSTVLHDTYAAYAPVTGLVEGKPSITENIFGRGLLSILKTEAHDPLAGDHTRT